MKFMRSLGFASLLPKPPSLRPMKGERVSSSKMVGIHFVARDEEQGDKIIFP